MNLHREYHLLRVSTVKDEPYVKVSYFNVVSNFLAIKHFALVRLSKTLVSLQWGDEWCRAKKLWGAARGFCLWGYRRICLNASIRHIR